MKATSLYRVWLFTLLLFAACAVYSQPSSDMETDAGGWSTVGMCPAESAPGIPDWSAAGGNPGGCIYAQDESVGVFYWIGNGAEWKGDLSAYYGCYLLFDLKTNNTSFPVSEYDIAIVATDDSVLTYNASPPPTISWTSYVIPLSAGSWIVDGKLDATECPDLSGAYATASEMLGYLQTLKRFRIRAEFSGLSYETNFLDNVIIDCDLLLPVEMLYFEGRQIAEQVARLSWSTSSEEECDGFVIQKSTNGVTFDSVGYVPGHGTTLTQHDYFFDDDNFLTTSYYRLKQLDFHGGFEYSNIIVISSGDHPLTSTLIYPNPATTQLTVAGSFPIASVRIANIRGSVVYEEPVDIEPTSSHRIIDTSHFPAGVYTITLVGRLKAESYIFEVIR